MIQLTHPKILEFYQEHSHLDPEQHHLAFLQLYDTLFNDKNDIIHQDKAQEILGQIDKIQSNVLSKFYEIKASNQEDLKFLLDTYSTTNYVKITEKLEQLLGKTLQNEYEFLIQKVQEIIKPDNISTDGLISNIQKTLLNSEDRIRNHISDIKQQQNDQEKVHQEILQFLNLYKTPSKKGEISENMIHVLLSQYFPSAEIISTAKQGGSGDCILKRNNKPTILFENKNYQTNVPKHEVDKFLHDIEQNNCSGIFMSQKSGITLKQNFEINIHKGNVLVYIHSMNYDQEKMLIAVDIIDQLFERLKTFTNTTYMIPVETMEIIKSQYQSFIEKRERILVQLNEHTKKMIQDIKELSLPDLTTFLSIGDGIGSGVSNGPVAEFTCSICNKYVTNNKRSLNGHLSTCIKKQKAEENK